MKINKDNLMPYVMFSKPIQYSEEITLHPLHMKDILYFQTYIDALAVRKNSKFPVKQIIKMSYQEFLFHCKEHPEYERDYEINKIGDYWEYAGQLLLMACNTDDIKINLSKKCYVVNGKDLTNEEFDDIRRIIFIQNDYDFDIDEFIHSKTEEALKKAKEFEERKNEEKANIEDYIDSLAIGMQLSEECIENLTIRKFWRLIKRLNKHEDYGIYKTAECSGMVKFKEPLGHWMASVEVKDKYSSVKTSKQEISGKVEG